jgi:GDP-mannose 6-dehydrogenase
VFYETHSFAAPELYSSLADRSVPPPTLSVVGLGRVGLVAAAAATQLGHHVLGVDNDIGRIERLAAGTSAFNEPGLDDALTNAHAGNLLSAATNTIDAVLDSDITLLCVEAPGRADGSLDLSVLERAAEEIGAALAVKAQYHVVVVRTTVPPGTTGKLVREALERASGRRCGEDFGLCFQPEFVREGTALADYFSPPCIVLGAFDARSRVAAASLHRGFEAPMYAVSIEAAEMVKYVHAAWGAIGAAFGNEVGRLCQAVGVDGREVMKAFGEDRRFGRAEGPGSPGLALAGGAVSRDVRALIGLAHGSGTEVPLIDSVLRSNDSHVDHAFRRIMESGARRIGLLGIGFDDEPGSLAESPQVDLLGRLLEAGRSVLVHDRSAEAGAAGRRATALTTACPSTRLALLALPDLMTGTAADLVESCDLIVVSRDTPAYAAALARRPAGHAVLELGRSAFRPARPG